MKTFKLYASNIPVKGDRRCTICDLSRGDIYFISQGLYQFLTEYENIPYEKILDNHSEEIKKVLEKEIMFLIENELGFFTDEPKKFPKIEMSWKTPNMITNAIVEYNEDSNYELENVFKQLDSLGCKFIELRFYDSISLNKLEEILLSLNSTFINSLILFVKYNKTWQRSEIQNLVALYPRIARLNIFGTDLRLNKNEKKLKRIAYHSGLISSNSCCGNIGYDYFSINRQSFIEAQNHNSCLNQKIAITVNGDIKNCPSLPENYGNIKNHLLENVISNDFKKYWDLTKDDINVCKDCEFRYLCPDCRAYKEEPDNIYSKPLKCGYSPYTNKWSEWSKNPLKERAIAFYDLNK